MTVEELLNQIRETRDYLLTQPPDIERDVQIINLTRCLINASLEDVYPDVGITLSKIRR